MALHGCLRCMKYGAFALNFVVWLAGMGVLGISIYLRMDPRANHYVKAGYANEVSTYHVICYILIGAGALVTFVGFLGCCGAFQESRCMMGTFFIFLFLIFAAEVGGSVWAFIHKDQIKDATTKSFTQFIKEDYTGKNLFKDEPVDFVQRTLHCCGGSSPVDWHNSTWGQHRDNLRRVPDSCCVEDRIPKGYVTGLCGRPGHWHNNNHPGVWPEGCAPKLAAFFNEKLMILIYAGLGIGAVELLSLIVSLTLCCCMRRESAGGYKA